MVQEDLLHEAASRGDTEVLAALLQAAGPACLCRTDGRGLGRTPLHSAIIHGQEGTAGLLIEQLLAAGPQSAEAEEGWQAAPSDRAGAGEGGSAGQAAEPSSTAAASGLDAADQQGYTALHWAALKGSTALVRRLLAAGANKQAAAADQVTPLHLAAKAGHVPIVHALLAAGACVTGAPMGRLPRLYNCVLSVATHQSSQLGAAACSSSMPLAPLPCSHALPLQPACLTAATDAHGWMPLHYVALRGDLALFVLLFSPSAPSLAAADGAGAALLTAAIRGGSSEMVGILLLTGATSPQVCPASRCCGASLDRDVSGQATRCCVVPYHSLQAPLAMLHMTPHLPAPPPCRNAARLARCLCTLLPGRAAWTCCSSCMGPDLT